MPVRECKQHVRNPEQRCLMFRAALSIWWALRTSPCLGPNPSVDRRVRWMRRAPGWQGAPDGQRAKKLVVTKCLFYRPYARAYRAYRLMRPCICVCRFADSHLQPGHQAGLMHPVRGACGTGRRRGRTQRRPRRHRLSRVSDGP